MSSRGVLEEVSEALRRDCRHDRYEACASAAASEVEAWQIDGVATLVNAPLRRCIDCGVVTWAGPGEMEGAIGRALATLTLISVKPLTVSWDDPRPVLAAAPVPGGPRRARAPRLTLGDVVLPAATRIELDEALAKVRYHRTIYEDWGFGAVDPVGRGVTLNFYGPPGTGKTRAAEAIAGELQRPLLQMTAGDLESRFMGETAKNIQAVFREAQADGAVLFFDEADSLFGRRASEVTQGVDHEVNVSKSTLLVELDRFEGVLVLATNFQQNFDRAFVRRISHHIHFRLPDRAARRALWGLHLVPEVPLDEPRETLLDALADASEGLSGGDVLTAMRLSLPAALLANPASPRLRRGDVAGAIERIRRARAEVATGSRRASPEALAAFFNSKAPEADEQGVVPRPHLGPERD